MATRSWSPHLKAKRVPKLTSTSQELLPAKMSPLPGDSHSFLLRVHLFIWKLGSASSCVPAPPAPPARTSRSAAPRGLCAPSLGQWGWNADVSWLFRSQPRGKRFAVFSCIINKGCPRCLWEASPGGLLLLSAGLGDLNQQGLPARVQEEPDQRALDSSQVEQRHRLPSPVSGLAGSSAPICPGSERGGNLLQDTQKAKSGFFGHPEPPWERKLRVEKGRGDRSCSLTALRSAIL